MFRKTVTIKADQVQTDKAEKTETVQIIEAILNNDSKIIKQVYDQQFNVIKSMVNNFKYLELDAKDVFQEGLTRAIVKVRNGRFKGESAFSTYLYGICRNICLKNYHKNKGVYTSEIIEYADQVEDDHFELLQVISAEKEKLGDECREIIDLRFGLESPIDSTRFDQIALLLNIKSDNARQRFGRCFAKLMKLLQQNREFKLLKA